MWIIVEVNSKHEFLLDRVVIGIEENEKKSVLQEIQDLPTHVRTVRLHQRGNDDKEVKSNCYIIQELVDLLVKHGFCKDPEILALPNGLMLWKFVNRNERWETS